MASFAVAGMHKPGLYLIRQDYRLPFGGEDHATLVCGRVIRFTPESSDAAVISTNVYEMHDMTPGAMRKAMARAYNDVGDVRVRVSGEALTRLLALIKPFQVSKAL